MTLLYIAFLVAVATAAPAPEADGAVEFIVNGVPEGSPLEIGHILDIKVQNHVDGQVVYAENPLFPLTAAGMAEAAVLAQNTLESYTVIDEAPEAIVLPEPAAPIVIDEAPEPIVLPEPASPTVVEEAPKPIVLPEPASPIVIDEAPEPIVLPEPASPVVVDEAPEPIVLPEPASPIVVDEAPEPIVLPEPASPIVLPMPIDAEAQPALVPTGEIYNDGVVQVHLNAPEQNFLYTVQSWFSLVLNYFNGSGQETQQIV